VGSKADCQLIMAAMRQASAAMTLKHQKAANGMKMVGMKISGIRDRQESYKAGMHLCMAASMR